MLKKFLILIFISQAIFTQNIFAENKKEKSNYNLVGSKKNISNNSTDVGIEDIFKIVEGNKNLYEFKNYELEKKSLDIMIRDNKLGDFNGINLSSNFSYIENVYPENYVEAKGKHYNKYLQNTATYGIFFVNFNYDYNRDRNKNNYVSYGVEKNLKDIFYSKHKTALKRNNFKKILNEIKFKKAMMQKEEEILDLYKKVFEVKDEIKLKNKAYEVYKKEYDKQKKSYDLGMNSKINLEAVQFELESIELELELLKENLKALYEVAKLNYDLDLEKYNLLELNPKFSIETLMKSYKKYETDEIKINLEIAKENAKFSKYNSFYPDLYFKYERVDKNLGNNNAYYKDQDIFSLRFSKKLFDTNSEYKIAKIEEENTKNYLEEKKKNIEVEKVEILREYDRLSKNLEIHSKKSSLENKKYNIKKLRYELGEATYLDVLDSYNKFLKQEIDTNKAKNNLNSFIYKLMIRS